MNSSENSYKAACEFFEKNFNNDKNSSKYYSFLWKILNADITQQNGKNLNGEGKLAILQQQNIVNDSTENDIKKLLLLNPFPKNRELYEAIQTPKKDIDEKTNHKS